MSSHTTEPATDWIEPPTPAPDFALADQNGKTHALSDYKGQPVVVYFYPRDDTPGCTKQACGFRDRYREIEKLGVTILGVSGDDADSHSKFAAKYDLPFPLLVDEECKIAAAFGAWREKNMYGKKSVGIQRSTFVIDASGNIAKLWKRVKVDGHDQQVIDAIKSL